MGSTDNLPEHFKIHGGPGRPKGSKNTRPLQAISNSYTHSNLVKQLAKLQFDVINEGVALFRDPDTPARTKYEIWKELMGFCYARPSSKALNGAETTFNTLNISWNSNEPPPVTISATVDEPLIHSPDHDND